MKYAGHQLVDVENQNGIQSTKDMHDKVLNFSKKYFTETDYNPRSEKLEKEGREELFNILYGIKLENISYAINGKISNTFQKGGKNHKDSFEDLMDIGDFIENEKNIYNLYILYSTLQKQNGYNGIRLFIHGGGVGGGGIKEEIE